MINKSLCLLFLILSIYPQLAQTIEWDIDSINDIYDPEYASIAVDQHTGLTHLAFNAPYLGHLYYAYEVGSGGNCDNGSFQCMKITGTSDVGTYNSIAVYTDPAGPATYAYITYHDTTSKSLMYAEISHPSDSAPVISTHTIRSPGALPKTNGLFTSVQLASDNTLRVSYIDRGDSGTDAVKYAAWVGFGSGNCGEGDVEDDFNCETIETGSFSTTSLALDLDDNPVVAYHDVANGYPRIAEKVGGAWNISSIPRTGKSTGEAVSLSLDNQNMPHLAYYNETDGKLEYATYAEVPLNGNCGWSSWDCLAINPIKVTIGTPIAIAIATAGGQPIIAYQGESMLGTSALSVARPSTAAPGHPSSNCGFVSSGQIGANTWFCENVDYDTSPGSPVIAVGMDIGRNTTTATIIYSKDTNNDSVADVMLAKEDDELFVDGFESGSTSAWE